MIPSKKVELEKKRDPVRFEPEVPVAERFSVLRRCFPAAGGFTQLAGRPIPGARCIVI
jgi:hypothetical protein